MAVNPMLTGANGIQQAVRSFEGVAQEVASVNQNGSADNTQPVGLDDMAELIVDLKLYTRQVQASAKVVETADEVLGFLLDVRA